MEGGTNYKPLQKERT